MDDKRFVLGAAKGWLMLISAHGQSDGFTLIEVLIAMAILGLTLAMAAPSITTWIQNSQIRTASENIRTGLQKARAEAIRRNGNVEFKLDHPTDTGGTGWTITSLIDGTVVEVAPSNEGTRNVKLTLTPDGATTTTFNGFGRLLATAANPLVRIDVDSASLSASDSHKLRIVILDGSDIKMCDPDPTITDAKDPRACP